jgi:HK97 family phage portal protein
MNFNFWENFFGVNITSTGSNRYIDQMQRMFPMQSQIWGKKEAVWVDTQDIWRLFIEIPELRSVINKRASMMASNKPCLYKNDVEVESHWLLDLIKKPNAVQSWSDVVYTMSVQDALYSNTFCYTPKRSLGVRNLIVPLPANKIKMQLTGKKLKQMDANDLIEYFTFMYDDDSTERIVWEDMLYLTTDDGMNIVKPCSRIETLKYPLSNIKASYHKRNVLLENIGAIGILSAQQNDMGGAIPMTPEEKNDIRKDWYNRQKDELIITEANVNWQPMSYPTKDLMLFEELTEDKLAIIDAFGLNYNLFSSVNGATFSNVKDSIRMVYTDTIIPETQSMYDSIIKQFGMDVEGYRLYAEFDHLPILQHDELASANVLKIKTEAVERMLNMNVGLTPEEARALLDL